MPFYKFSVCEGFTQPIKYKDCRLACRGCKINPCYLYYQELLRRLTPLGIDNEFVFLPPKGFEAEDDLNPFQIVVDLYALHFHDDWEICLSRKQNIADCVFGCNSSIYDHPHPIFHPHQWNADKPEDFKGFEKMISKLTAEVESQNFENFEDIIGYITDIKMSSGDYKGFGLLGIYDASLRLAWHAAEDKESLLPKEVYLHRGAKDGAECLLKLGLLKDVKAKRSLSGIQTLKPSQFPKPISKMEPHHIENLLCIFHPLFRIWTSLLLPEI